MSLIDPDVIKNSTVWQRELFNNGRYYEWEYFGYDAELVEAKALAVINSIDPYRSPKKRLMRKYGDMYYCIVSYYGLD